jgi:hypothetical protein
MKTVGKINKDEQFVTGYYTFFGDGGVHLNPTGELLSILLCKGFAVTQVGKSQNPG